MFSAVLLFLFIYMGGWYRYDILTIHARWTRWASSEEFSVCYRRMLANVSLPLHIPQKSYIKARRTQQESSVVLIAFKLNRTKRNYNEIDITYIFFRGFGPDTGPRFRLRTNRDLSLKETVCVSVCSLSIVHLKKKQWLFDMQLINIY